MAIQVDYTPMAAVGGLAREAGVQQQARQRQAMQFQADMAHLQQQFQQQNQAFQFQAQQAARAEEFGYQTQLIQMKRQIDTEMELKEYARNREKLNMALDSIRTSDYLNDAEREELTIMAVTQHGGVGQGVGQYFGQKDKLTPDMAKLQNTITVANTMNRIKGDMATGAMDYPTAMIVARQMGVDEKTATDFLTGGQETVRKEEKHIMDEFTDAQKALRDNYEVDIKGRKGKETVRRKDTKGVVQPGTPEYVKYKAAKDRVEVALYAMSEMLGVKTERVEVQKHYNVFVEIFNGSPSMQAEAERKNQQGENGFKVMFEEYLSQKRDEPLPGGRRLGFEEHQRMMREQGGLLFDAGG